MAGQLTWGGSLHQTFRILETPSPNLKVFLSAEGLTPLQVLGRLPYDKARVPGSKVPTSADARRYRDGRQVYQTAGLLYEGDDHRLHITDLGRATLRWLDVIHPKNVTILGRHAAYALAACQLRNPTRAGLRYDPAMTVFPFAFIWRAMLQLDARMTSDEMNRALFRVQNEDQLAVAIAQIASARAGGTPLGAETITGPAKSDRIIPWISIASFGWTLIANKDKDDSPGFYTIPARTRDVLHEAAMIRHRHRTDFSSVAEYVQRVSDSAALPPDLR
ncbi:MAG: hypothetical protein ACRENX_01620 [Candidatus Dormibacteria bacterium]